MNIIEQIQSNRLFIIQLCMRIQEGSHPHTEAIDRLTVETLESSNQMLTKILEERGNILTSEISNPYATSHHAF